MPFVVHVASRLKKGNNFNADYACDGADDDVQIQDAIDTANGLGGGTVYLQAGTYNISRPIQLYDYVKLIGSGPNTVIKLKTNANCNAIEGNEAEYAEVSELRLEGNSANNPTGGDGLALNNNKFCRFHKLYIHDFKSDGVSCTPVGSNVFENNIFDSCEVWENTGHGFNITAKDCLITNCYIYNNTTDGIRMNPGSGGWQIVGCHIYGNAVGIKILANGTVVENNLITGSFIEFNDYDGIYLADDAKNNVITGNLIWNNSRDQADTYDGIKCESPNGGYIANNVITGNHIWERHRYSISIDTDTAAPANVISGNDLEDNVNVRGEYDLVTQNTGQATNVFSNRLELQEISNTPGDPAQGTQAKIYLRGDKLIIQFNDGGTVRYKYLDLTGTGVTWTHTTTAPT